MPFQLNYRGIQTKKQWHDELLGCDSVNAIKKIISKDHTKELRKNSSEEIQIPGGIVSHGWWKRFDNCVNAKYSLKKLHHKILRTCNLLENNFITSYKNIPRVIYFLMNMECTLSTVKTYNLVCSWLSKLDYIMPLYS